MRHGYDSIFRLAKPPFISKTFCIAGVFLLTSTVVFAQRDTTKHLKEVPIKASTALRLQTLIPAQQITQKDFAHYSAFNVADAVRNFAGVNIKDYGGIGGLKTISVRSLGTNHTAVLYDGVQLNDAQSGQIDLSKFNLNNVQEITLYNGQPGDLLQPARSFASASVLSIKTIRPTLTAKKTYQIQVGAKVGSFGLINPYLQWQQRVNNNWQFVINGNYIKANGRYKYEVDNDGSDTLSTRHHGDVESIQTDAALYYNKNDSSKFNIHINYYNAKRGLPGAVVSYTEGHGQQLNNDDVFVQTGYERLFKNGFSLLLYSKLSQLKTRYLDSPYNNIQGFILENYKQREAYQSVALSYHLTNNWDISYAIDASYTKVDADIDKYAYPARFTLLNVIASSLKLGKLQLQGNLLQTNIHETVQKGTAFQQKSVLSPTLMATVQPFSIPNLKIRAFYKNVFRAPTLDELYYYAFVERVIKPEFVYQYDLGATYSKNVDGIFEYIAITADAYYNYVKNKILAVPNSNPAIFSFSNLGKVDIKGIDLGFKTQTKQHNGWSASLNTNYTYQQAIDVSDPTSSKYLEQIPYTPKHTLAINAGVNYKDAGVYFNHIMSSGRYYTGNNLPEYLVPGYSVTDASAIYKFISGKMPLQTSFEVNNLFNTNYAIIRSFPMPGRSYRLSIQITI
ncbi:TonB-dependent receptor [Mucilaginibacter sp. RB4R14]|uniref:TonB-dependent receptor plug domain-containing protein n=1 Tax=Mucilaginibacter aurantiaciroseus TaxID=2949308 RepID=UPI0020903F0F|nr:TonB-dependent receptor [Mucilaginibacter aurantiaciroseus]MCO5935030.1 TonB-dependent receptor [Mucilaginibacter aurantiaciroseus]